MIGNVKPIWIIGEKKSSFSFYFTRLVKDTRIKELHRISRSLIHTQSSDKLRHILISSYFANNPKSLFFIVLRWISGIIISISSYRMQKRTQLLWKKYKRSLYLCPHAIGHHILLKLQTKSSIIYFLFLSCRSCTVQWREFILLIQFFAQYIISILNHFYNITLIILLCLLLVDRYPSPSIL